MKIHILTKEQVLDDLVNFYTNCCLEDNELIKRFITEESEVPRIKFMTDVQLAELYSTLDLGEKYKDVDMVAVSMGNESLKIVWKNKK